MDPSQTDLEAIRRILAELTTRVYRIERRLEMESKPAAQPHSDAPPTAAAPATLATPPTPPPATVVREPGKPVPQAPPIPYIPPRPSIAAAPQPEIDLESRIGSHWLNRIGIAALLIGISYFLKFAFDNNWIGPAGRVTIGLLAGIAVVVWSERFRARATTHFPIP